MMNTVTPCILPSSVRALARVPTVPALTTALGDSMPLLPGRPQGDAEGRATSAVTGGASLSRLWTCLSWAHADLSLSHVTSLYSSIRILDLLHQRLGQHPWINEAVNEGTHSRLASSSFTSCSCCHVARLADRSLCELAQLLAVLILGDTQLCHDVLSVERPRLKVLDARQIRLCCVIIAALNVRLCAAKKHANAVRLQLQCLRAF